MSKKPLSVSEQKKNFKKMTKAITQRSEEATKATAKKLKWSKDKKS